MQRHDKGHVATSKFSVRMSVETYLLLASFRALLLHCALSCFHVSLVAGSALAPNLVHFGADRR